MHFTNFQRQWSLFWDISQTFFLLLRTFCSDIRLISNELFVLLTHYLLSSYMLWILNLCEVYGWQRFSFILWAFPLTWLFVSLAVQRHFSYTKSHLLTLIFGQMESYSESSFLPLYHVRFCLCFINELIYLLLQGDRQWSNSFFGIWISTFPFIICWRCFIFSSLFFRVKYDFN